MHHCGHRRHQENDLFVPTSLYDSSKRECGVFPEHHDHRVKRRRSHYIYTYRLCAGGPIIITTTTTTTIIIINNKNNLDEAPDLSLLQTF